MGLPIVFRSFLRTNAFSGYQPLRALAARVLDRGTRRVDVYLVGDARDSGGAVAAK